MAPSWTRHRAARLTLTAAAALLIIPVARGLSGTSGDPGSAPAAQPADAPRSAPDTEAAGADESDGRTEPSNVALSSPIDPDAQFYWQLDEEPESLIPLDEIISGGPPPDGIPAIDNPVFVSPAEADEWLEDNEPVIGFDLDGDVRAYPIQILMWHEIVNDVVADRPVAVTFCPLCNSAIVFDRAVGDQVLDFGTSGRLWHSDLVMYDRQTKSMWPQIEGRSVVGQMIGEELDVFPSSMIGWADWRDANPDGQVLSRDTGFQRSYGTNPYGGYDEIGRAPFLFRGEADGRLAAMERVVAVDLDGEAKAYPFSSFADEDQFVIHDRVGDTDIVVFFEAGTSSALDTASIAAGRDVGATGVFLPTADDQELTFEATDDGFVDAETGSVWNLLGEAVEGPLEGSRLERVVHLDNFWFAWASFKPDTIIWEP